jgi:hypothetical protein
MVEIRKTIISRETIFSELGVEAGRPTTRPVATPRHPRDHLHPPKGVMLRCIIMLQTSHRATPSWEAPIITPPPTGARWGRRYAYLQ